MWILGCEAWYHGPMGPGLSTSLGQAHAYSPHRWNLGIRIQAAGS